MIEKINALIALHDEVGTAQIVSNLSNDRAEYIKHLIEMELIEEGHSLKGMYNLSKISKDMIWSS